MKSLIDYLNNTQQCESILDPNQDQVMDRMTDDMIRERIREYCTWGRQKYKRNEMWIIAHPDCKITKVDKDKDGWYIETEGFTLIAGIKRSKSYYDYCSAYGYKIDKQKGLLIEDIGVYFQWSEHFGVISIVSAPNLESTKGLPDWQPTLILRNCCKESKRLDVCNKIKVISLRNINDLQISGNGCKNIVVYQYYPDNIIAPDGVKIYHPGDYNEYSNLIDKLSKRKYTISK